MDLRALIVESARLVKTGQSTSEKMANLAAFKSQIPRHMRLFIPGRVLYMYKTSGPDAHYVVEESSPDLFGDVGIRRGAVIDHFINKYDDALRKVILSYLGS
jgi:hypothetical protein